MRISDWSSDVCSSDLRFLGGMGLVALVAAGIAVSPALGAPDRLAPSRPLTIGMEDGIGSFTPASADPKLAAALARSGLNASGFRFTPSEASQAEQHRVAEIGRAAWRERGGQEV